MSDNKENESAPNIDVETFVITPDFSPEDYTNKWSDRLCDFEDEHEERNKVFQKFYKHIWNLLFGSEATEQTRKRAIELLDVERTDACYFNPFDYNDWIRTVRDEIIKREMYDFWQTEFVAKKLGLIWARDSDYFDDMEDPEPAEFYKLRPSDPPVTWN